VHSGWFDCKTRGVRDLSCGDARVLLELEIRRIDCWGCGQLKRKRLESFGNSGATNARAGRWSADLLLSGLCGCF
jgi:hypothetical protein